MLATIALPKEAPAVYVVPFTGKPESVAEVL